MESKKVCSHCQTENNAEAKFCASCGSELTALPSRATGQNNVCKKCGAENAKSARFCSGCGTPLRATKTNHVSQKPPKKSKKAKLKQKPLPKKSSQSWYLFGILAAVVFIYFIINQNSSSTRQVSQQPQYFEQFSNNPAIERQVKEIAANFGCSCGSCGELPLDTCTCNTAVRERQFIRSKLLNGQDKEQVIAAVKASYGGFKTGQSLQFNPGDIKIENPLSQLNTKQKVASSDAGSKIAEFANRVEIYSHFSCPCGQCGVPELKDCNCNHVRGATEVKKFVDEKINEEKYTVTQIVDFVENQYGHKIR